MATAYANKLGGKHSGNTCTGAWIAIAHSNVTILDPVPKALMVCGAGTLVVADAQGDVMIIPIAAATTFACSPVQLLASGTNALGVPGTSSYDGSTIALTVYALF